MIYIKSVSVIFGKEKHTFNNVLEAQKLILSRSENFPTGECGTPILVRIIYEDGQEIELFMDCKHPDSADPDLWIVPHLHNFLMFYAGKWKPDGMTEYEYRRYQDENKIGKKWFVNFIEKYETGLRIDLVL